MSLDDTSDRQWRLLASEGKDLEAANLIMTHIMKGQSNDPTTYFHAGQEYACAGKSYYPRSIECFKLSYKPGNEAWNIYVDGSIAFLQQDKGSLDEAIRRLQQIPDQTELHNVLVKLATGLEAGLSYKESYDH